MGSIPASRLMAFTRMSDLDGKREFRFPDIRGWTILNTTGHEVGKVEEVFVDPNTLEPAMVLLHYQKFLNRNTKQLLVPWSEVRIVGDRQVQTRPAEEEFANAPEWTDGVTEWAAVTEYWDTRAAASASPDSEPSEDEVVAQA